LEINSFFNPPQDSNNPVLPVVNASKIGWLTVVEKNFYFLIIRCSKSKNISLFKGIYIRWQSARGLHFGAKKELEKDGRERSFLNDYF